MHEFFGDYMDKSVFQMDPPDVALERRFKFVTNEKTRIKATFDRIRAQVAQEAEQRSRPVSRIYSGFRAVKAWSNSSTFYFDCKARPWRAFFIWHSNTKK